MYVNRPKIIILNVYFEKNLQRHFLQSQNLLCHLLAMVIV